MPLVVPGINSKDSSSQNITNPVIPNEEQVKAGVFDKKSGGEYEKAMPEHYTAAPGPVVPDDKSVFEKASSREELHARAKELNKD